MKIITPNKYEWEISDSFKPFVNIIRALSSSLDIYPVMLEKEQEILAVYPHNFLPEINRDNQYGSLYKQIREEFKERSELHEYMVMLNTFPYYLGKEDLKIIEEKDKRVNMKGLAYFTLSAPVLLLSLKSNGQREKGLFVSLKTNKDNTSELLNKIEVFSNIKGFYNEEEYNSLKKELPFILAYRENSEKISKESFRVMLDYLKKNDAKIELVSYNPLMEAPLITLFERTILTKSDLINFPTSQIILAKIRDQ